ncbi:MAG: GNAT family N-acetyltransferase [Roseburia sp.]
MADKKTILGYLKQYLPEFELRDGDGDAVGDIWDLITGNEEFLASTQNHGQTMEECEAMLTARPPQVAEENKHFLTIYGEGECIALLDYLECYPDRTTVYLGLLVVEKSVQNRGIGRELNDAFMRAAAKCGYREIRLGCYAANETGYQFWRKNRYIAEKIVEREVDGEVFPLIHMACDISDTHMFESEKERKTVYRAEQEVDCRASEEMTKRAFWNKYVPGCMEHYLLHLLREGAAFVPELSLVAEVKGKIVGGIWYSKSKVKTACAEHEVLTFGPLCVVPEYQGTGIGGYLLEKSMRLAREAGYPGIIILGEPEYYPKHGFVTCDKFGITTADGKNFDAFMGLELTEGAFAPMRGGKFYEAAVFGTLTEEAAAEYDRDFPQMEKLKLPGQWN